VISKNSNILSLVKSREETLYNDYFSLNEFLSEKNIDKGVDWKEGKKLADQMINKCQQILEECRVAKCGNDLEKSRIFSLRSQATGMLPEYRKRRLFCKLMFKVTNVSSFIRKNEKEFLNFYKSFKSFFYDSKGNHQDHTVYDFRQGGEIISFPAIAKCQEVKQRSEHCIITNENEKQELHRFLNNVGELENLFHREPLGVLYEDKISFIEFLSLLPIAGLVGGFGVKYLSEGSGGYALALSSLGALAIVGVANTCKRQNLQKIHKDSEAAHAYMQQVEQRHADLARLKLEKNSPPA
jgi:hypothetical protein